MTSGAARQRAERALAQLEESRQIEKRGKSHSYRPVTLTVGEAEELARDVVALSDRVEALTLESAENEAAYHEYREWAEHLKRRNAERDEQIRAAEERVAELEKQLSGERVQRTWAFNQLRAWWRGEPRDMSDPVAAVAELDRVERALFTAVLTSSAAALSSPASPNTEATKPDA